MPVEATLTALLSPLVGDRVFPDIAPFDTPRPYITYQQIGGTPTVYADGSIPSAEEPVFQINVWGDTRASVSAAMRAVDDALRSAAGIAATPQGLPVSDYDHDNQRYGARQDFAVFAARS